MLEFGGGCLFCFKLRCLHAHRFLDGNNTSTPRTLWEVMGHIYNGKELSSPYLEDKSYGQMYLIKTEK